MKNSLIKKLNGYYKASRKRFLLLHDGVLTQEELLVYELGIAIADWDPDHQDICGTFYATNAEMAHILGWKSDTTVGRIKNSLIKKGYFKKAEKRFWVRDFDEWQFRKTNSALNEPPDANIKDENAISQVEPAKMQAVQPQNNVNPLGSYKVNLSITRTNDEYLRIWKENFDCSPTFTPDDMRWIDQNVFESSNVPS